MVYRVCRKFKAFLKFSSGWNKKGSSSGCTFQMRIGIQRQVLVRKKESEKHSRTEESGKKKLILAKSSVLITFTVIYSHKPSKYRHSTVVLVLA